MRSRLPAEAALVKWRAAAGYGVTVAQAIIDGPQRGPIRYCLYSSRFIQAQNPVARRGFMHHFRTNVAAGRLRSRLPAEAASVKRRAAAGYGVTVAQALIDGPQRGPVRYCGSSCPITNPPVLTNRGILYIDTLAAAISAPVPL